MRNQAHPREARRRALSVVTAIAAAVALTAGAAGCSGSDDTSGLPDISEVTTPPATPTGPALTPEQQAVVDAVAHYDQVMDAMTAGQPMDMKKITAVTVNPWRQKVADNIFKLQALKQRVRGKHKTSVRSVKITGDTAEYVKCGDSSDQELVYMGPEPTVVAGGTPPKLATLSMIRINRRWLVKNVQGGQKCRM